MEEITQHLMNDIPYRNCAACSHIEDCPSPFTELDGRAVPPRECPKPECVNPAKRTVVYNGNI